MRAVIYTRISSDRDGDSASPARQEALCRQMADARGWEVVEVLEDRNRSAWRKGVVREEWERLRQMVRERRVDVVLAYSLTRLGRRVTGLLDFVEFLQEHGVQLAVYNENLDTSTPAGQVMYTMVAALAQMESAQTSERVRSATRLAAQNGKMHAGGHRQFGFARDGSHVEDEAEIVRELADRVLAGETVYSCASDLNARGVTTTTGKQWTMQTLGQMLRSPRLGGFRSHRPGGSGSRKGRLEMFKGDWLPILDSDVWTRLCAELDSRKSSANSGSSVRAHLLTGLVVCGKCGEKLFAHFSAARGPRKEMLRYQCSTRPGSSACGGVAVSKPSVEVFVTDAFFDFMAKARLRPVEELAGRSLLEIEDELREAEQRLSKLVNDHYVRGLVPDDVFLPTHHELNNLVRDLRARCDEAARVDAARSGALVPGDRSAIAKWWQSASLDDQRRALGRAISWVVVHPAKRKGGNVFDTTRVEIQWSAAIYKEASIRRHPSMHPSAASWGPEPCSEADD